MSHVTFSEDMNDFDDSLYIGSVREERSSKHTWFETVLIESSPVSVKIDTGAGVNCINSK